MHFVLLVALGLMQTQPAFEVASVKPTERIKTDTYNINLGKTNRGVLTMGNVTLSECLKFAYGFADDIQLDGPDWMRRKGEVLFDIIAKAAPDTPREQLLIMLQGLLAERFKLVLRREQRQASYLALLPGKKGLKMGEADPAAPPTNSTLHLGHIVTNGIYMRMLATVLSRFLRQPVIDMTGLPGPYAVKLDWTPDPVEPSKVAEGPGNGPSIYTALQDQLGLRLESRKGPLEVLIVDHAERVPVSN